MDSKKYKKLDELLNQTDMYTQFLMEHLNDASTAKEEVVEAEDGKAGCKRKAGKAGGKNAKRQKATSPTQVRHMSSNKSLHLSLHVSRCCTAASRLAAFCIVQQSMCLPITTAQFQLMQLPVFIFTAACKKHQICQHACTTGFCAA